MTFVAAHCSARYLEVGDTITVTDNYGTILGRIVKVENPVSGYTVLTIQDGTRLITWATLDTDEVGVIEFHEDRDRDPECPYCGGPSPSPNAACGARDCLAAEWQDMMYG